MRLTPVCPVGRQLALDGGCRSLDFPAAAVHTSEAPYGGPEVTPVLSGGHVCTPLAIEGGFDHDHLLLQGGC